MLDGPITDSLEADALLFNNDYIHIKSSSWGPTDDGKTMEGPNKLTTAALKQGAEQVISLLVFFCDFYDYPFLFTVITVVIHKANYVKQYIAAGLFVSVSASQHVKLPSRCHFCVFFSKGRDGLGMIYMWATGNGGMDGDTCSCDGYVSSIYTVAIGSISDEGLSTYFSEICPATLAVIFTGGSHKEPGEEDYKSPKLKIVSPKSRL